MSNHVKGWNATIVGTCKICEVTSPVISDALGLCPDCISRHPEQARKIALGVHARSRKRWALPGSPPRDPEGIVCNLCVKGQLNCILKQPPILTWLFVSMTLVSLKKQKRRLLVFTNWYPLMKRKNRQSGCCIRMAKNILSVHETT